jgi:PAS domain S-box-containing protein
MARAAAYFLAMQRKRGGRLRYLTALWAAGILVLAIATAACFVLKLNFATTAFIFLIVIVLLSLLDSFVSSAVFSLIAVSSLNFFFTEPLFTFYVSASEDIVALAAFLITSLAVTGLVRRLGRLGDLHRDQTRLLDLTHDPVLVRDMSDAITFWNRGAEELYGWKRDEAFGKVAHQLLQTVFPDPLEQIKQSLLHSGRWEGELVHTRRDGRQVVVASRWALERDDGGRLLGILETNNDITDRRRAEEALRRTQETYLAEAQQLSHTGSFGWNVASGEIFWSEESFRIFGYDPSVKPTLGMMLQHVHPDDIVRVREVIERARTNRENFDFEHRLLLPDGSVKHLHVVAHCITDDQGQVAFMGAMMDITARCLAEEELRSSERRYRHLFEYMPIAMFEIDPHELMEMLKRLREEDVHDLGPYLDRNPDLLYGMMDLLAVKYVNNYAVRMFGARDRSELVGPSRPFWQKRPDTFRRAMESRFRGELSFQEETDFITRDGREIHVFFSVTRLNEGTGLSLIGLIDLTERMRAQERLQRVQADFAHAARLAVLGELGASIAHEVNQPLAATRTNGETALRWLNRSEPNVPKAQELIQHILEDAGRAADIIARIRAMAAGRGPKHTPLGLEDVIGESMLFLRHELQSKGVSVSLDLAPALPQVIGDRTQLQQVVVNLALNAVQAMTESGSARCSICIRTMLCGPETVNCVVEDSGPGIDPEHLPHLFDTFFTTKGSGMGMGLPISRSIIEAHSGRIYADNKSSLGGARFRFALPASTASAG